ncbi:MAG: D-alanyl-D-alanine carboxypeptidase, partial [Alphaproteobacteria bacterium]|nr:D-alanyl-D-alanine carboxypeptidase [Alphaproteobacteria bacterium]
MFNVRILISLFALQFICLGSYAATFETKAKQVVILDYETGAELYAKNADEPMHPASMSKMMTVYMLFDRPNSGAIKLDDTL